MNKRRNICHFLDEVGTPIIDKSERLRAWEDYIKTTFNNERPIIEKQGCYTVPEITIDEVKKAISQIKDNKVAGPDGVYSKLLKVLDRNGSIFLTSSLNEVNDSGDTGGTFHFHNFISICEDL